MQHGPLHSFHLYLRQGFALAKYSTREEASKVSLLKKKNLIRIWVNHGYYLCRRKRRWTIVFWATQRFWPRIRTNGRRPTCCNKWLVSRAVLRGRGSATGSSRAPVATPGALVGQMRPRLRVFGAIRLWIPVIRPEPRPPVWTRSFPGICWVVSRCKVIYAKSSSSNKRFLNETNCIVANSYLQYDYYSWSHNKDWWSFKRKYFTY